MNGILIVAHAPLASALRSCVLHVFPDSANAVSALTADAGIATVSNTNTRFLDAYEGADGIKTGYTSPAGFNLTASAHRGNKHIIATVFGGTSTANRNAKMVELMDMGFGKARQWREGTAARGSSAGRGADRLGREPGSTRSTPKAARARPSASRAR